MGNEKVTLSAGFDDLSRIPETPVLTPLEPQIEVDDGGGIYRDEISVKFPLRFEPCTALDYDPSKSLWDLVEVITTGNITYELAFESSPTPENNVLTWNVILEDVRGDGTVQLKVPPGLARNGYRYEQNGCTTSAVEIDTVSPVGTITYSPWDEQTNTIVATLEVNEEIQPTEMTHTFTKNGKYTFTFYDLAGNKGTAVAVVNNFPPPKRRVEINDFKGANPYITMKFIFEDDNPPAREDVIILGACSYKGKNGVLSRFDTYTLDSTWTVWLYYGRTLPGNYDSCEVYCWDKKTMKPLMDVQRLTDKGWNYVEE